MKKVYLRILFLPLILVLINEMTLATELVSGVWILEIERYNAPMDEEKLEIIKTVDGYEARPRSASTTIENLYVNNVGEMRFTMNALPNECLLKYSAEADWHGTCPPPEATPESEDLLLTVRLRKLDTAKPKSAHVVIDYKVDESLPGELAVYIVANAPQITPPLAVRRIPLSELPTKLELTDADAMTTGLTLSNATEFSISAFISKSGSTDRNSGDWQGIGIYEPETDQYTVVINNKLP